MSIRTLETRLDGRTSVLSLGAAAFATDREDGPLSIADPRADL